MFEKFTERARKVMSLARQEAQRLNSEFIGTEHILLGLIKENEGIAAQVLTNLGLKLDEVRDMVLEVLGADVGQQDVDDKLSQKASKSKTPALDAFGRDLMELARDRKLDPVIGRRKEIERVMQV